MLDKINELFSTYGKKKILGILAIFVVVAAVVLTVVVALQQQTIRQRASEGPVSPPFPSNPPTSSDISLKISPSSVSIPVNGIAIFDVYLDTGSNQLTGIDFTLNYNGNVVELQESTIGDNKLFNNKLHDIIGTNTYRYSAVTTGSSLPAGETNLGTITFLAKAFGQDTPTFQNAQIAILGNNQTVQANTESSTITVSTPTSTPGAPTATPSSTPTPTAILLPTSTPLPLPTFTPTPIPSVLGDANGDNSVDILDFNIWRTEFLNEGQTKDSDFNNDGIIDIADFAIWRNAFNPQTPSQTSTPIVPQVGQSNTILLKSISGNVTPNASGQVVAEITSVNAQTQILGIRLGGTLSGLVPNKIYKVMVCWQSGEDCGTHSIPLITTDSSGSVAFENLNITTINSLPNKLVSYIKVWEEPPPGEIASTACYKGSLACLQGDYRLTFIPN